MRNLPLALTLVALLPAGPVRADNAHTAVSWKGWRISSSEALWRGRKHTGYPLTFLFDDNPATAWVFSGKSPDHELECPYFIVIATDAPVRIDELRIMNGYNKSRSVFLRNDRVIQLRITGAGDDQVTADLPDAMGWHSVPLPPGEWPRLILEFLGRKKGPAGDLCISELALYSRGKKVDFRMPQAVIGSDGGEAESDTSYLMMRTGKRLIADEIGVFDSGGAAWSEDGKRVASVERGKGGPRLWVASPATGKVLLRRAVPRLAREVEYDLAWTAARRLRLKVLYSGKDGKPVERTLSYGTP